MWEMGSTTTVLWLVASSILAVRAQNGTTTSQPTSIDISDAISISTSAALEEARTSAYMAVPTALSGESPSTDMFISMMQAVSPDQLFSPQAQEQQVDFIIDAISANDTRTYQPDTKRRDGQIKIMIVGDSMTQGAEGDWTWRYRLWQWFKANNIAVDFVGPYSGTRISTTTATSPQPPPLFGVPKQDYPNTSGRYAADVDPAFDRDHFAIWGRPVAIDQGLINGFVQQYQPDYLLVMLGFNDLGWFYSDEYGLINNMGNFINQARAANPKLKFAIANVPQRSFIGGRQDLVDKTTNYNKMLPGKLTDWSTTDSPCVHVELQHTYSCAPDNCPAGYDGLHPDSLGDYQIASAFTQVLYSYYKLGTGALQVPSNPPARPVPVPSNFQVSTSPQGVTATWSPMFGAYGYYVQVSMNGGDWTQSLVQTNRWDTTWASDGQSYAIKVSTYAGELPGLTSDWTAALSATAKPQIAPAPQNARYFSGDGSMTVYWDPPTGQYSDGVTEYEIIIWDQDTECDFIQSAAFLSSPAVITGLKNGHRYMVFPLAWTSVGRGWPNTTAGDLRVGYTSPPGTVSGLQVTAPDDNHVYATWSAVPEAAGYQVWTRNTLSQDPAQRFAKVTNPCFDSYIFYPAAWAYEFCFSAINGAQESGYGSAQCIQPAMQSTKSTPPTCPGPKPWCPSFGSKATPPAGDGDAPAVTQTLGGSGSGSGGGSTATASLQPTGTPVSKAPDPNNCRWSYTFTELHAYFGNGNWDFTTRFTTCVFYHGTFREAANNFVCQNQGYLMMSDIFLPPGNPNWPFGDPLECAKLTGHTREFFRRVSELFASLCFGDVLFMWDGQAPFNIGDPNNPADGWHTQFDWYEYPILVNNGANIIQVNPSNFNDRKPYVPPPDSSKAPPGDAPGNKMRRSKATFRDVHDIWSGSAVPNMTTSLARRESCVEYRMRTQPNSEQVYSHGDSNSNYVSGYCGLHIVERKALESYRGGPAERYNMTVKDNEGNVIGQAGDPGLFVPVGQTGSLASHLPYLILIDAQSDTSKPISLQYAGFSWQTSDSSRCQVGKYDGNERNMDCGFGC